MTVALRFCYDFLIPSFFDFGVFLNYCLMNKKTSHFEKVAQFCCCKSHGEFKTVKQVSKV